MIVNFLSSEKQNIFPNEGGGPTGGVKGLTWEFFIRLTVAKGNKWFLCENPGIISAQSVSDDSSGFGQGVGKRRSRFGTLLGLPCHKVCCNLGS